MSSKYDVAIVGGGLVGTSLACALSNSGLRSVIVDSGKPRDIVNPGSIEYDDRVLAISPGSRTILEAIAVWDELDPDCVVPIKTIHISDRRHFGFTRLQHNRLNVPALGYAVPAKSLGIAVQKRLISCNATTQMYAAQVSGWENSGPEVRLNVLMDSGQMDIDAALVVFAGGTDSKLRKALRLETVEYNYHQSAIVTSVTPARGHRNTAYERFTDTGPLAMLPSVDDRYTVVWTTRDSDVKDILAYSDSDFLKRLQYRFGDRAGQLSRPGKRSVYSLSFIGVKHPIGPRMVVVGNAAHTLHPVAGQGFNLGLRDVSALAEVLYDSATDGGDHGHARVLEQYWKWRRRDTVRMSRFTDGLIRLFSSQAPLLALPRDAALMAFDLLPPMQHYLTRRTMGLAGRLPRLSRGIPLNRQI